MENKRIAQAEEWKLADVQERAQQSLEFEKQNLLHAKQAYKEKDTRCTSLMNRFSIQNNSLEDQVLLDCSKTRGDLDSEFNKILSKITLFSKGMFSTESRKLLDLLDKNNRVYWRRSTSIVLLLLRPGNFRKRLSIRA